MILGSHIIFGAYGFWLPNDPRGSWSEFVGNWEMFRYGPATKTTARHSVANARHDTAGRLEAKTTLNYPAVQFTGEQALAVGQGFGDFCQRSGLMIWACAILREHIHLVVARFRYDVEELVIQLKGSATSQMNLCGLHPLARFPLKNGRSPKAFARGEWKVFLNSPDDVVRSIQYVENNPLKEGLPRQRWSFVRPFVP